MARDDLDVVIVGQGLAGTTLAWRLLWSGRRILVIDDVSPGTASRVAAGLITPITGPRLAKTWGWDTAWPAAVEFYQRVERETSTPLLYLRPAVRLFRDPGEAQLFQQRREQAEYRELLGSQDLRLDSDWFDSRLGGFEMPHAARLDVTAYLHASREAFRTRDCYLEARLDLEENVHFVEGGVLIKPVGIHARRLALCVGHQAIADHWFATVGQNPCKGELLTVRIPGLSETRSIHREVWIAPQKGDLFQVGATFDWEQLDDVPTQRARAELLIPLADFLRAPLEVVGQQAAVRPTTRDGRPNVGLHPQYPQLAILNGFGTRGALLAPWLSEMLVDQMEESRPIDPQADVRRWFH